MGDVYLAEDTRLGRRVAIKFPTPGLGSDPLLRLRNEGQAAAHLSHPNIATLHDIDSVDDRPFLVFEYVEGQTLRDRVEPGPLSVAEVLDIGIALASGLAHAHSLGVIHRDVKSANVMMSRSGEVKILDFGLARRKDASLNTAEGTNLGTAAYMSPEQTLGQRADHRSDIWGIGVVLYECITGLVPFRGESFEAIVAGIQLTRPEPPTALRTGVPLDLERVILRCLEKDPGLRIQSAEDLLAALRLVHRDSGGFVTAGAPGGRAHRVRQRMSILGLLAVALTVSIAAGIWFQRSRGVKGREHVANRSERVLMVLPFDYQGDGTSEYLRRGVPNLLSMSLDTNPAIRAIDPHTLLGSLERNTEELSSRIIVQMAREKFAADVSIRGNIMEIEGSIRIRAFVVDTSTGQSEQIDMPPAPPSEIMSTVDILAARILSTKVIGVQEGFGSLAAFTTDSPEALRAFLEGERILREDFRGAAQHYEAAVAEDSTFALALYRLSIFQIWTGQSRPSAFTAAAALRHAERLPTREKAALEAWYAYVMSDAKAAIELYGAYVRWYPDDIRGWKGLGESEFHLGYDVGLGSQASFAIWSRVLRLQPGDWEGIRHLGSLLCSQGLHEEYMELIELEEDYYRPFARLLGAGISGDPVTLEVINRDYDLSLATGRNPVINALGLMTRLASRPLVALPAYEFVREVEDRPEYLSQIGLDVATVELALGRGRQALRELDLARVSHPEVAFELATLWSALPDLDWQESGEEPMRKPILPEWVVLPPLAELALENLGPFVTQAFADACRGDADRARACMERLDSHGSGFSSPRLLRAWSDGIEATIAMERGDWATAEEITSRIEFAKAFGALGDTPESVEWGPVSGLAVFRLIRGQALRHLDRNREAAGWLDQVSRIRRYDPSLLAIAELELGRIHEALGDESKALDSYRQVMEWMSDCDERVGGLAVAARIGAQRSR